MKDYNITVKVRNNYLLSAMRSAGLETAAALSRVSGATQSSIGEYLNLKQIPISKKTGEWRENIIKISDALSVLPEDLFPPQHIESVLQTNRGELEMSIDEIGLFIEQRTPEEIAIENEDSRNITAAIDVLPFNQGEILRRRFGIGCEERTLKESGMGLGRMAGYINLSTERVRQIEHKAMRNLKNKIKERLVPINDRED
jgi:RNA polymerase sigma factor (sigma-70 family)